MIFFFFIQVFSMLAGIITTNSPHLQEFYDIFFSYTILFDKNKKTFSKILNGSEKCSKIQYYKFIFALCLKYAYF